MKGIGVEIGKNPQHQTDYDRCIENGEHKTESAVQPAERNGLHKIGKQLRAEIEKQHGNHYDYHERQYVEHRRGYGNVLREPVPDIVGKQICQISAHKKGSKSYHLIDKTLLDSSHDCRNHQNQDNYVQCVHRL